MDVGTQLVYEVPIQGMKKVELIARGCYKSENYITEDSWISFCKNLIASGHTAPFEHGYVYFELICVKDDLIKDFLLLNKYAWYDARMGILSMNYRVLIDAHTNLIRSHLVAPLTDTIEVDVFVMALVNLCPEFKAVFGEPNRDSFRSKAAKQFEGCIERICDEDMLLLHPHLYAQTFKIITDRGITHETVRHKEMSFMQESTRYCNYAKDKFNNNIRVIEPKNWDSDNIDADHEEWCDAIAEAEAHYLNLINVHGWTPQDARSVLPTATKSEIYVTGPLICWKDWNITSVVCDTTLVEKKGFLGLRNSSKAHPMMQIVAKQVESHLRRICSDLLDDTDSDAGINLDIPSSL